MKLEDLKNFLVKAKTVTYAAGDIADKKKEVDDSTTLVFEDGDYSYHDNYFGGEPYGGREVVFYQGKPVWMMVYYGWVEDSVEDVSAVYRVLQKALMGIESDNPYRGQKELIDGDYRYSNNFFGDVENFSGEEIIYLGDKEVYRAKYMGGLVSKR